MCSRLSFFRISVAVTYLLIIPIHDAKSVIIESDDRVNVRDKVAMENVMP